jgi:hypothetical protein
VLAAEIVTEELEYLRFLQRLRRPAICLSFTFGLVLSTLQLTGVDHAVTRLVFGAVTLGGGSIVSCWSWFRAGWKRLRGAFDRGALRRGSTDEAPTRLSAVRDDALE